MQQGTEPWSLSPAVWLCPCTKLHLPVVHTWPWCGNRSFCGFHPLDDVWLQLFWQMCYTLLFCIRLHSDPRRESGPAQRTFDSIAHSMASHRRISSSEPCRLTCRQRLSMNHTRISEQRQSWRGVRAFGNNPDGVNYSSKLAGILQAPRGCLTAHNRAVNKTRTRRWNYTIVHVLIFQWLSNEQIELNIVYKSSSVAVWSQRRRVELLWCAVQLPADTSHRGGLLCTKAKRDNDTRGFTGTFQRLIVHTQLWQPTNVSDKKPINKSASIL